MVKTRYFPAIFRKIPVYPGCLVIESVGQLALCLYGLKRQQSATDRTHAIYLTRIDGALFLRPILPGIAMRLLAAALPERGMYQRAIGQALDGDGKVAMVMIGEILIS